MDEKLPECPICESLMFEATCSCCGHNPERAQGEAEHNRLRDELTNAYRFEQCATCEP